VEGSGGEPSKERRTSCPKGKSDKEGLQQKGWPRRWRGSAKEFTEEKKKKPLGGEELGKLFRKGFVVMKKANGQKEKIKRKS